ncbi:MAG: caspase family protein [Pseudomonadota bacterium]
MRTNENNARGAVAARWMRQWLLLAGLVLLCLGPAQAQGGKRIAILVGNAAYEGESRLANPHNDAALLAGVFKNELRFDEVIQHKDLNRRQMFDLVREVGRKAKGADAIVVYYSGHGMRGPGGNYLIPVDARIAEEDDVRRDALAAADLAEALQGSGARVGLLILDACRDSPFTRRTRSATKGLTRMGVSGGNLLVAYATTEGSTADDGKPGNSPYAQALAQQLRDARQPVLAQFDAVRRSVREATGGRQNPTREGDLEVGVHLVASAAGAAAARMPQPAGPSADAEQYAWDAAARTNSEAGYRAYLNEYPQGRFASAAKVALASLAPAGAPRASDTQVALARPASPSQAAAVSTASLMRSLPSALNRYEKDIGEALRCTGPVAQVVERFENVVEGTWSIQGLEGKAMRNVSRFRSVGGGLSLAQPEFSETDFNREWAQVVTPAGPSWTHSDGRWTSGVLAGSTQSMEMTASEIECSGTFFPLQPGKEGTVRFALTNATGGTGNAAVTKATKTVAVSTHRYRVLDGPMSAEAAMQRYKWLRLAGPTASQWRVYEMEWSSDIQYRELQVPAEARQYYKPTSNTGKLLFVEGPNFGVADAWVKSLKDGWTVTLRQLP